MIEAKQLYRPVEILGKDYHISLIDQEMISIYQ